MLDIDGTEHFCSKHDKFCSSWVATAIVGGAVIGGIGTAYAANKASSAQENATATAAKIAQDQYNQTRGDLAPYRQIGTDANAELQKQLPFLISPITMDQATLEKTPGYQFTLQQGLKSVQNSAAARGLGTSGAAQKGAATYATGLADKTYQDQFNLENINRTNAYSRLKGLIDTGAAAAGAGGALGQAAANTAAGATIGGGNAAAAGINSIGTAIGNVANAGTSAALIKGLYGPGDNAPGAPGNYGGSPETNPNLVPIDLPLAPKAA